jgi:hypothetical protein
MDEVHTDIARLEERIERLAERIERCRKISLGAKIAIAAGAAWLVLMIPGVMTLGITGFLAAVTAMIGGVVLLGSNATTWEQTIVELQKAEAARADLIGGIDLRLVHDAPPMVH